MPVDGVVRVGVADREGESVVGFGECEGGSGELAGVVNAGWGMVVEVGRVGRGTGESEAGVAGGGLGCGWS